MFKKNFLFLLTGFLLVFPMVTLAKSYGLQDTGKEIGYAETGSRDVYSTVNVAIQVGLSAIAFIFFGLMLYAGFMWMTAGGVEEKVTKAKGTILAAVIGLIVIAAAYAITKFVLGAVGQ